MGVGLEEMRARVDKLTLNLVEKELSASLRTENNVKIKKQRRMSKPPDDTEWEVVEDEEKFNVLL